MRNDDKSKSILLNKSPFYIDFHYFMELEGSATNFEIAEELGITLGEVHLLKKKINRT